MRTKTQGCHGVPREPGNIKMMELGTDCVELERWHDRRLERSAFAQHYMEMNEHTLVMGLLKSNKPKRIIVLCFLKTFYVFRI